MFEGEDLRKRQIAAGYTMEELEQVLGPDVPKTARKRLPAMGDDTPSAVLSKQYRPLSALLPSELLSGDKPAHR